MTNLNPQPDLKKLLRVDQVIVSESSSDADSDEELEDY